MKPMQQVLRVNEITDDLKHIHSKTIEDDSLILDIKYLGGKFTIQRTFINNWLGKIDLKKAIEEFNTEEKVRTYLGL